MYNSSLFSFLITYIAYTNKYYNVNSMINVILLKDPKNLMAVLHKFFYVFWKSVKNPSWIIWIHFIVYNLNFNIIILIFLPEELVLRNNIVAFNIALNIFLCNTFDDLIVGDTNMEDLMKILTINVIIKRKYTITQVWR